MFAFLKLSKCPASTEPDFENKATFRPVSQVVFIPLYVDYDRTQ